MAMVQLWTVLWISGYCHLLSAEVGYHRMLKRISLLYATTTLRTKKVLVQYKYFLSGEGQGVSLQAPAETNGTEFIWEWTSHDGSYTNARIITIQSDGKVKWNLSITRQVEPSHWSSVKEGSDVIRSCEVSHLPDSATLDWERDREPTANTTLIYNNTAHIIIHSADRYSEGTYNCILRWNGALIFSIPKTLNVSSGTYDTRHTLYRGSLNSSEVVLICLSWNSYLTAYLRWEPSSGKNAVRVASADKYENASISMEIDKKRFSSERYDGSNFPLRISPVKFGDSGMYFCFCEHYPMASVTLVTVQDGRMLVIGVACTAAVCVGVLLLLFLLFRRLKTAAGPSTSPAEGNGAADAVYSDVTDLQQGQADGNGDSSAAAAVYRNVAELQKDQGNQDTPKEENDSEELQYFIFSLSTPSLVLQTLTDIDGGS